MASFETHCEDCVRKLGKPFPEVHRWLDEHFRNWLIGPNHREIRHHEGGVEKVRQMWGDEAAQAAIIHIERDELGRVPSLNEARLYAEHHKFAREALEKEFPEDPYA